MRTCQLLWNFDLLEDFFQIHNKDEDFSFVTIEVLNRVLRFIRNRVNIVHFPPFNQTKLSYTLVTLTSHEVIFLVREIYFF